MAYFAQPGSKYQNCLLTGNTRTGAQEKLSYYGLDKYFSFDHSVFGEVSEKREELTVEPTAALNDALMRMFGTDLSGATEKQVYRALCTVVREFLTDKNHAFDRRNSEQERKEVYYMSMEFLVGTSLRNRITVACDADMWLRLCRYSS